MIRPICMNGIAFRGVEQQAQNVENKPAEPPVAENQPAVQEQKGAEALANYNAAMIQKPETPAQPEVKAEEKPEEPKQPAEAK
ncbi:hypothetical protein J6E39_08965 [bacterium]|nr:hypothetical protein [bacterium]